MDYILKIRSMVVKDIEDALQNISFAKLSKIKDKLLEEMLEERRRNVYNKSKELDMDELDQVVAARGEEWRPKLELDYFTDNAIIKAMEKIKKLFNSY